MANIIGLTNHRTNQTIMVNADQISHFNSVVDEAGKTVELLDPRFAEGDLVTEILMIGGAYLLVREDIFQIVDMIDGAAD